MPPFVRDEQPSGWFDEYPELQEILNMQMMHPMQPLPPIELQQALAQAQAQAEAQATDNNDIELNMEIMELIATVTNMLEERNRLQATMDAVRDRLRRSEYLGAVQEVINIRNELGQQPEQTEEVVRQLRLYDEQINTMLDEYDQMD
ncbi:uncharacterized protein DMAD_01992 [Drosophila madeirensis]|uniref:Uncharacterized protein n=1 Tax=Drosophila madeirensis TaxID=30013 RepID=A0AAU9G4R5_DROMD